MDVEATVAVSVPGEGRGAAGGATGGAGATKGAAAGGATAAGAGTTDGAGAVTGTATAGAAGAASAARGAAAGTTTEAEGAGAGATGAGAATEESRTTDDAATTALAAAGAASGACCASACSSADSRLLFDPASVEAEEAIEKESCLVREARGQAFFSFASFFFSFASFLVSVFQALRQIEGFCEVSLTGSTGPPVGVACTADEGVDATATPLDVVEVDVCVCRGVRTCEFDFLNASISARSASALLMP